MQIGEAIIDRQEVIDLPGVRDRRAYVVFIRKRKGRRVLRVDRNVGDGRSVEIDQAIRIRRFVRLAQIEREIDRMAAQLPLECRPNFVVAAVQIAKTVGARERAVACSGAGSHRGN